MEKLFVPLTDEQRSTLAEAMQDYLDAMSNHESEVIESVRKRETLAIDARTRVMTPERRNDRM